MSCIVYTQEKMYVTARGEGTRVLGRPVFDRPAGRSD